MTIGALRPSRADTDWQPGAPTVRPKSHGLRAVTHLVIRTRRSMPSVVCSRPSWVSMKQA